MAPAAGLGSSEGTNCTSQLPLLPTVPVWVWPFQVTETLEPASALPVKCTPSRASAAVMTLSPPSSLMLVALAGAVLSTVKARVAEAVPPAGEVTAAVSVYLPSAMPVAGAVTSQWPLASAVAATLLVPKVSSTFEPASAEPCSFTPAAASAALMMSSLAMLPMTGALLLVCSVTEEVAAGPRLPAASMAVAVSGYWPSAAGSSAADSVVFHLPSASTATSLVVPPILSSTVPLASAVPETATPAVFSAAVMMLSPLTAAISALAGGVLS